jgi:hypothetical protein
MAALSELSALPSLVSSTGSTAGGPNPYLMPPSSEKFRYRQELDDIAAAELSACRQMTLVQRASLEHSAVPPLVSRGTIHSHLAKEQSARYCAPDPPHTTRRMNVPEFVAQRREIFLIQLMIKELLHVITLSDSTIFISL